MKRNHTKSVLLHLTSFTWVHIFPYAFDEVDNSLLDVSGEKPSGDAVILLIDTYIYVNGKKIRSSKWRRC